MTSVFMYIYQCLMVVATNLSEEFSRYVTAQQRLLNLSHLTTDYQLNL